MYIKPYQENNPIDFIEEYVDSSTGESIVHTSHLKISQSSISDTIPIFPNNIPIDFLCKSDDKGKELFIVYSPFIPKGRPMEMTFVVDNKFSILLSSLQPTNNENGKHYHNEKLSFPLSYDYFISFCNAKSLKYQINENNNSKMEDGENLIPLCKLLFNAVFDKGRFPETADYLQEKQKELFTIINKLNNNN